MALVPRSCLKTRKSPKVKMETLHLARFAQRPLRLRLHRRHRHLRALPRPQLGPRFVALKYRRLYLLSSPCHLCRPCQRPPCRRVVVSASQAPAPSSRAPSSRPPFPPPPFSSSLANIHGQLASQQKVRAKDAYICLFLCFLSLPLTFQSFFHIALTFHPVDYFICSSLGLGFCGPFHLR